jgi:chromosomal replication initiator protein
MQGFWDSCLSRFEKELPAQQFSTWIRPLRLDASAAPSGELRLFAPNRFVLQWVKERFLTRIEAMGAGFSPPHQDFSRFREPPKNLASPQTPPQA